MRVYMDLLKYGTARRLIAATAAGKLGFAIFPLATVLLGHDSSGSFLDAGAVAGAWSMGGTVTGPLRGHLVDRYGHRVPLAALALLTAVAATGLATAPGTTQLICFGALAGAAAPFIVASIRLLWTQAVSRDLVRSAYALDAVLTEATKICGPLLAAAAAAYSPQLGVVTAGTLLVTGTCPVALHPPTGHSSLASGTGWGVLASPALRLLCAANACGGLCLGALTVALPAQAAEQGSASDAGWMFACLAAGSALVGTAMGTRHRSTSPNTGYLTAFTWLALALTPLTIASTSPLLGGASGQCRRRVRAYDDLLVRAAGRPCPATHSRRSHDVDGRGGRAWDRRRDGHRRGNRSTRGCLVGSLHGGSRRWARRPCRRHLQGAPPVRGRGGLWWI
ncbi:MFS transporter [Streptomyces sp. ME19-01-6]|uniref:MFS transporter n=1 Tax=Streptomyces sp. ME19-01-6 TaxID=3028686 RepID=UPI0029B29172|nr:MFS transporter [Streptomyces sp. ME19-01-6]MDX3224223.1 hypothetical protein [Streptomyces sp. ME19-01-6]